MPTEEEISIKVNIFDRYYPLRISVSEEESFRRASKAINEKAKYFKEHYQVQDKQDTLALAALDFATDLDKLKGNSAGILPSTVEGEIDKKLSVLEQLLKLD